MFWKSHMLSYKPRYHQIPLDLDLISLSFCYLHIFILENLISPINNLLPLGGHYGVIIADLSPYGHLVSFVSFWSHASIASWNCTICTWTFFFFLVPMSFHHIRDYSCSLFSCSSLVAQSPQHWLTEVSLELLSKVKMLFF